MMRRIIIVALCLLIGRDLLAQELTAVTRASQDASGAGHTGFPGRPEISPNGKLLVFSSNASDLVSNDTNFRDDIFMSSTTSGLVSRINLGPAGVEADEDSANPDISTQSPNGFLAVVFDSAASNLARSSGTLTKATSNKDIFFCLPNYSFKLCERLSLGPSSLEANGDSTQASVAILAQPNRILVAYRSEATNLVSGDTNGRGDIFLATISAPDDALNSAFDHAADIVTARISKASDSLQQPNDDSFAPQISADGKFVAYESDATNLVSGVTPAARQIYLYDVEDGTTTLVSKSSSGAPGNSDSRSASLSFSGRYLAYLTTATNIIDDGFTPSSPTVQVILYNTVTAKSERVNVSSSGVQGNGSPNSSLIPAVSSNGQFVLFSDTADNLVSSDGNGEADIFIRNRAKGTTTKISQSTSGGDASDQSLFAGYGQTGYTTKTALTTFISSASNLINSDNEGSTDVFVGQLSLVPPKFLKGTVIETPADVTLPAARKVSIKLQPFKGVDLKAPAAVLIGKAAANLGALKEKVEYLVEVSREVNNKKTDRKRKIVKKASAAFANLKPGFVHIIRYQVQIVRGTGANRKIIKKSKFSPEERVLVE